MIGVIAKLTIKPGGNAAFEAAMKPIVAKVRAEPGNKLYALYRTSDATGYLLLERYDSKAALDAHRAGPNYEKLRSMLVDHLASRPDWQDLDEVE